MLRAVIYRACEGGWTGGQGEWKGGGGGGGGEEMSSVTTTNNVNPHTYPVTSNLASTFFFPFF